MLKALYDYAIREKLTLPPGYVNKTIKAYINLSADGHFLSIETGDDDPVACPDIGSLANSKDKSNLIVEKYSVILPEEESEKNRFFRDALKEAGEYEEKCLCCLNAIEDEQNAQAIREELNRQKIKASDRISFTVDGVPLVESEKLQEWWSVYRQRFAKSEATTKERCVITGQLTTPVATVPKITGLHSVGGHSSGDALICFDKPSFGSYGLKQAANAPVSQDAMSAVKAALDELLKDAHKLDGSNKSSTHSPIHARNLGGMKLVHWYDCPIENDIMDSIFDGDDFDMMPELQSEEPEAQNSLAEERKASKLVGSYRTGEDPAELQGTYYILLLSGVNGRVMIRSYERGSYQELYQNIKRWYQDLALSNSDGTGLLKSCKLIERMMVLLKKQKEKEESKKQPDRPSKELSGEAAIPFYHKLDRLSKELSGVTPSLLNAIFTGAPLPDAILTRALAYVRSDMMGDGIHGNRHEQRPALADVRSNRKDAQEDTVKIKIKMPDSLACQWLKAYLCRKERREGKEDTMAYCNPNHPKVAYHCGRLMAVYASIQRKALGDVDAGVVERYYTSACQTPALVFGRLAALSNFHLSKIENKATVYRLSEMLNDITVSMGDEIPVTLSLEEQAYFALGYRQQYAEMARQRIEYTEKKKENNNTNDEEESEA